MIKNSVVLVPFPFDDFSGNKVRPAVCLTSEIGQYNQVVIAFISSKIPTETLQTDIVIEKNTQAWKNSGLFVRSVIRLHKVVTIPKWLIKRKLGNLDSSLMNNVQHKLKILLELD